MIRHYSPETGRFLSEDPIGFAGGQINQYVYVFNNPVLYIDPSGKICISTLKNIGYGAMIVGGVVLVTTGPVGAIGFAAGASKLIGFIALKSVTANALWGISASLATAWFTNEFTLPAMTAGSEYMSTGYQGIIQSGKNNGKGNNNSSVGNCKSSTDHNVPWYELDPNC